MAGLGLSIAVRPGLGLIALAGLGLGYAYDLRLKSRPWSWLPFAFGIGLLPLYAWYGASGDVPPALGFLVPAAVLGGTALALANQLADDERDRASGVRTTVGLLGRRRAWQLIAALHIADLLPLSAVGLIPFPAIKRLGDDETAPFVKGEVRLGL